MARQPSSLSAFDLDHTLFNGNSSFRFGIYLYRQGVLSFRAMISLLGYYVWQKAGWISLMRLHEEVFKRHFKGFSVSFLEDYVQAFLDKYFDELIYVPGVDRLREAQLRGDHTVILSSSPQFLVRRIAERFGVDEWDSTHYAVDQENHLCSIERLMEGDDKATALQKIALRFGIARENVIAYSDSYLDLPFLEAAGVAIGVNPERKLRQICDQRQWQTI